MKSYLLWGTVILSCWSAYGTQSQNVAHDTGPGGRKIIERGPNHRKWATVSAGITNATGKVIHHTNVVTEIATGLYYKENGKWVESSEAIEIRQDGTAAGIHTAHQVNFAANVNDNNPLSIHTP